MLNRSSIPQNSAQFAVLLIIIKIVGFFVRRRILLDSRSTELRDTLAHRDV